MEGEDDVFEIEKILESFVKKGIRYYRVRWKGFSEDDDTWEPEENLFGCKDVLDQYWKENKKSNQTLVKKRKSESTNQSQTAKAKKNKNGRTTNNSTIARIDSSPPQGEQIIIANTNRKVSSKTKRKRGTDEEVHLKNKRSDTKSSSKSKETTKRKKKQKKVVDLSLKTDLDQACEIKQTLDDNENTKDIEQILTAPKLTTSSIESEAYQSTVSKSEPVLHRENSHESSESRSVGKRRSWSSYEASPEFVPEYCDDNLAYHFSSEEEEFEYYGDTGFAIKGSIGYDFRPTGKLATDEVFPENNNLMEDGKSSGKDNHDQDAAGHAENDEVHVKDDEDHVKDDEDHVKDDEDYVEDDEDHVKDDGGDAEDDEDHVKDDEDHVKSNKDNIKAVSKKIRTDSTEEQKHGEKSSSYSSSFLETNVINPPEHELSDSTSGDNGISGHNIHQPKEDVSLKQCVVLKDEKGDTKSADNNIDLLDSDCGETKLNTEENGAKTLKNDVMGFNKGSCDGGDETTTLSNMKTLKRSELKLEIRCNNFGDTSARTDSEGMSPEFVKLPEPQKDYFDKVFTESIRDENATPLAFLEQKASKCDKTKSLKMKHKCDEKKFSQDGLKKSQSKTGNFETVSDITDDSKGQSCTSTDPSPIEKQRKLSEEETAHCLLDLSSVRINKSEVGKTDSPSFYEEASSIVMMDLNKSDKLESRKEMTDAKTPHVSSGKNKDTDKSKTQALPRKGRKVKPFLNLPFINQGSQEVLDILDNAMRPTEDNGMEGEEKSLSSTEQKQVPTSTKEFKAEEVKTISAGLDSSQEISSDQKSNHSSQTIAKNQLSSINTSEKKPEVIAQNVSKNEQNIDSNTASSIGNSQSDSSNQGVPKVSKPPSSVNGNKDLDSQGRIITQVYGRGRYEEPNQGNESWSSDTIHSAQFSPTSLNYINPNLYPDLPSANTFIVSHMNHKDFLPGPFDQQPFPTQANINVHQKPFSAVAGINWYPQIRPRQMGLATHRAIAPKPFYYMPALPVSLPYSRQATPDYLYARALQEMAQSRQSVSSSQSVSSTSSEYSSPIDADRAWYAKHVGDTSTMTSSHNVESSGIVGKDIKNRSEAEVTTNIANDTSISKEKANTRSSIAVAEKKESSNINKDCASILSKPKSGNLSANPGLVVEISAISQSEGKSIDKEKDKNKDFDKGNDDSTARSFKDVKNANQRKPGRETLDHQLSADVRTSITERGRDRSTEKKSDSRGKDTEISRKREDSFKIDSWSEKELKREDSVDSEVEFDLDDYNPGEVVVEKVEKTTVTHTGIPAAVSLREVKTAIKQGDSTTVLASLAGGMNIDSQDSVTGMTLLMRAVSFGQEHIVRLLLNHGANVNIKDNTGSTPLIVACEQGYENIVALLLNAEVDINAKQTLGGETALIKACTNGFDSVVAMLLAQGADCQMRSVTGLTAAQLAVQSGYFGIRDLLESHGKKLQRCVETAIASCLCDSSRLMYPPLLPFVSLYPAEGQKFTYHFHCSNLLLSKTVLLFCLRAVFSRSGQVDLSFSKDNGVHTVLLNGSLQSPVLSNNKSVFVLRPKLDTNRLILQTYQSHVHLLVCIYAAELDEGILNIEPSTMAV